MPEGDGLLRIFWPRDLGRPDGPNGPAGVVVGWRNSPLDVFVVTVLDGVDPVRVELALKMGSLFGKPPHPVGRIWELCGHTSMHVLGVANPDRDSATAGLDPSWVLLTTGRGLAVPMVYCPIASNIQVVLYDRPSPTRMQFVSLNPISLALEDNTLNPTSPPPEHKSVPVAAAAAATRNLPAGGRDRDDHAAPLTPEAEDERVERQRRDEKRKLVAKLRQHLIFSRVPSPKERALPKIVHQINWALELDQLLHSNVSRIGPRPSRALSVSERVAESAATVGNYVLIQAWTVLTAWILPVLARAVVLLLIGHRIGAEALLCVLEFRVGPRWRALKDVSATAQQVEIRLQQFCYWPVQFMTLRRRKVDWASVTTSHPDYIRFYNSLWLVANDVIIGIALGLYIIERAGWVADRIGHLLTVYTVESLRSSIEWLMGWPAGLKLNSELAAFLGDLFLWVIAYWASCIDALRPTLPRVILLIGFSSFAGASMPIAMFSDMLSVLTMHIYSFYLASARIFHWQLSILQSLFHLFRGKKHNVLRNRIDSCDYDLDQLLVGTILFTLLSFLLPTVAVFYINFAIARMVIIAIKALFDTLLSCLNHFPLFAIMLRLKDPRRLPGGVRFELQDTDPYRQDKMTMSSIDNDNYDRLPTSVIRLKSTPLPFGAIFDQYFQMAHRIRKHYVSARVVFCLLTGKLVPPINRKNLYSLQYSMLPSKRARIGDVWIALNAMVLSAGSENVPWGGSGRGGRGASAGREGRRHSGGYPRGGSPAG